jgi:hypothetical protein
MSPYIGNGKIALSPFRKIDKKISAAEIFGNFQDLLHYAAK